MMKTQNAFATAKKEDGAVEEMDHLRKMFIGGLSAVTTEDTLRAFYQQWGDVIDVIVMRDPATKRSRGFGFITYSDSTMVDRAQASRPHVIDGKTVDSKRALPRPELGKSETSSSVKKIFVGGLKENHDEQSLTDHFSQFGNVVSVKILTDKTTGRKRGFAFVEFDDYDAVDKAVLHKNHTIKYVLVDVKKSVYKQELAKKLASQQQSGMMMPPGSVPPPSATYQQPAAYPQAAYAYPQQVAAPAAAYNGWSGYAQPAATGYQQQPPAAVPGYGAYGAPPQNGAAGWSTATYPAATTWGQNGYGAPAATPVPAATPAPAANWGTATGTAQNFGDYQQTYNGGPQKASTLQGNRMNPYSVSSAPNYGSNTHAFTPSSNIVSIPTTANVLPQAATTANAAAPAGAPKSRRSY